MKTPEEWFALAVYIKEQANELKTVAVAKDTKELWDALVCLEDASNKVHSCGIWLLRANDKKK